MPDGGPFCSQISLVFSRHVLMEVYVSIDVEGNVVFPTAYDTSIVLALLSHGMGTGIHHGGRTALVHVAGVLTGI